MEKNKIILGVVSVIAIFAFLTAVYIGTNKSEPPKIFDAAKTITKTDHVTWSKDKKHILTEYGDFQCPACGTFHEYIKENIENDPSITKNITFVYRNFPLQGHKHAQEAAYAAEAAGKQGKFFEMSDLLFDTQKEWEEIGKPTEYFLTLATKLKLDIEKFNADKNSKEVKEKVKNDMESGGSVDVNSTPTFYLDGSKVEVATLDGFKKQLQDTAKL